MLQMSEVMEKNKKGVPSRDKKEIGKKSFRKSRAFSVIHSLFHQGENCCYQTEFKLDRTQDRQMQDKKFGSWTGQRLVKPK
jgi:hypothetical protein